MSGSTNRYEVTVVVQQRVYALYPSEKPLTRFSISSLSDFMCSLSDSTVSNNCPHSLHLNNSLEGIQNHKRQDLKNLYIRKYRYLLLFHCSMLSRLEIVLIAIEYLTSVSHLSYWQLLNLDAFYSKGIA